jgi:enamine deaminase RidA (YjgF/YER057c/UK114 family)
MIHRLAYSPSASLSFHEAFADCLQQIDRLTAVKPILGIVFFVNANTMADYHTEAAIILSTMHQSERRMPANILAQPNTAAVSMEVWIDEEAKDLKYLEADGQGYTRYTTRGSQALLALGLHASPQLPLQSQAEVTFQHLYNVLEQEGLTLTDIVRQWNYVPEILALQNHEGKTLQHYQVFNVVRKACYAKHTFRHGYPAATGIGVKTGPFSIDVLALASHTAVDKKGLSNPNQQNAYQYDQQQLIGDALCGQQKNPPLFERAKLLAWEDTAQIIVSGTASILGQETVGLGDVSHQTEIAIQNMLDLLTPAVTGRQKHFEFNGLRVYIKQKKDYKAVKDVCQRFFPGIPTVYVQADVCRDNLLMEIEGEAVELNEAP